MTTSPYPEYSCTVTYEAAVPCVVMAWRGYATSQAFRNDNARVLAAITEHRASRLLGDIKEFVLIGGDDQNWLMRDWIPRAQAAGLRFVALVTPIFYFNRVAVETVGQALDPSRLMLQYFDNAADARAWLASCPS